MSLTATAWAEQQRLTGRKMQLLRAIARAVDETGACRSVTQDGLAASCGCTVRQVRRLVGELAAGRYLAHRRRGRRGGGRAADLYVLPREAREGKPSAQMSALDILDRRIVTGGLSHWAAVQLLGEIRQVTCSSLAADQDKRHRSTPVSQAAIRGHQSDKVLPNRECRIDDDAPHSCTISCCWLSSRPRRRLDIVCPQ